RVLAVGGGRRRLAVLRSVALPEPSARLCPPGRAALARRRSGRRLRLRRAGRCLAAEEQVFRAAQAKLGRAPEGVEPATLAAGPRRAPSDLPRRRRGGGIRP